MKLLSVSFLRLRMGCFSVSCCVFWATRGRLKRCCLNSMKKYDAEPPSSANGMKGRLLGLYLWRTGVPSSVFATISTQIARSCAQAEAKPNQPPRSTSQNNGDSFTQCLMRSRHCITECLNSHSFLG